MTDEIKGETYKPSFVETIPSGISKEEFVKLLSEQYTEKDKEVFGEDYREQMFKIILFFSVFGPHPATFDSNAIAFTIGDIYTPRNEHTDTEISKIQYITERAIQLGSIEPNDDGHFYITQEKIDKLKPILDQF